MKYLVILGDGMADYRVPELGNKTPLEAAKKDVIDFLSAKGELGLVKTVPDGIAPGSDSTNLSIMSYDPEKYYTGRSPLEAVSMGIDMSATDLAVRCNLVTLSEEEDYNNKVMIDYSSDEISTAEAAELIDYINQHLGSDIIHFYSGISYRHCMIWKNGPLGLSCTPPHDILEKSITNYLPAGVEAEFVTNLMVRSYDLLKDHPVNISRKNRGLRPANSIWLWGEGRKPLLSDFCEKFSLSKGSVISAVDLIKGIGLCAGLKSVDVPGATGTIDTNYDGKAQAVIDEFEAGADFVYVHIEAPDECGHRYEIDNKVRSIELIDEKIASPLHKYLDEKYSDYAIMVLPDHPTPLSLRTHTNDPVPFLIYRKVGGNEVIAGSDKGYNEFTAKESGLFIEEGYRLMERLIKG
jgi:2,3-bisphosphoglycerate-independent phosphoglycerate mutase